MWLASWCVRGPNVFLVDKWQIRRFPTSVIRYSFPNTEKIATSYEIFHTIWMKDTPTHQGKQVPVHIGM